MSGTGRIVEEEWRRAADLRDNLELDEFVVMPNHFHGNVCIVDDIGRGGTMGARV